MRAGGRALAVFTRVLNAQILSEHAGGALRSGELEGRLEWAPKASLRVATGNLREIGALARVEPAAGETGVTTELTAAGLALLELSTALEDWISRGPLGSSPLPDLPARRAIRALAGGWDSTIVMALATSPHSLHQLGNRIPGLSYPILKRRLAGLRSAGLVSAGSHEDDRRSQLHRPSPWLRAAVGPLSVASLWEEDHITASTERMTWDDIEAAFLLTLPLIELSDKVSGQCVLATPAPPKFDTLRSPKVAAVTVAVERGKVVSCGAGMPVYPGTWALGSPRSWLEVTINGRIGRLRVHGTATAVAREVSRGISRALFAPGPAATAVPGYATGSRSGGSSPPRSVPAISSSGAGRSGMKPDFMPK